MGALNSVITVSEHEGIPPHPDSTSETSEFRGVLVTAVSDQAAEAAPLHESHAFFVVSTFEK